VADQSTQDNHAPVVLGFFAHPDDETLSAGGVVATLARYATVHIVTATRGEMGEVVGPIDTRTTPDRHELPLTRTREVKEACAHLGVASHRFLDGGDGRFVDSGMAWEDDRRVRAVADAHASDQAYSLIDIEQPARDMAQLIEALQPTLVLTEEPAGGYGHPDHIRCHDVMMRALHIAAPQWKVPFVAFPVWEESRWRQATTELVQTPNLPQEDDYGVRLNLPEVHAPLRSGVSAHPDLIIDTSPVIDQVVQAMRAHATQVHQVTTHAGTHMAGSFALTNNDLKPIPTHAGLVLAPGWGSVEGLHELFPHALQTPKARTLGDTLGRLYTPFVYAFALFTGVLAGFVGTFSHRNIPPWGVIVALIASAAGAVFNRAIGTIGTTFVYGLAVIASVATVVTFQRGGDVVVAEDALGLTWMIGVNMEMLIVLFTQVRNKAKG